MIVTKRSPAKIPAPQIKGSLKHVKYPAIGEVKIDGEFNFLVFNAEKNYCFAINKYGTVKKSFPAIKQIRNTLLNSGVKKAFLTAEIHWKEGKLGALYGFLKNKKSDELNISILDVGAMDGDIRKKSLLERSEAMIDVGLSRFRPPLIEFINDEAEATEFFKKCVDQGYEGVVIKSLEGHFPEGVCDWVKLKYKDRSDYEVSIIDPVKERIEIVTIDPSNLAKVSVGIKACNKYKKYINVGDMVTIEHQGVLASCSLRHPVLIPKKEWK